MCIIRETAKSDSDSEEDGAQPRRISGPPITIKDEDDADALVPGIDSTKDDEGDGSSSRHGRKRKAVPEMRLLPFPTEKEGGKSNSNEVIFGRYR